MNRMKQTAAFLMAALMAAGSPAAAYASAPMTGYGASEPGPAVGPASDPGSGAAEPVISPEELQDNRLEYREIGARIREYNTDYVNTKQQLVSGYLSLPAARDLVQEAEEMLDEADALRTPTMDPMTGAVYESYKNTAAELRRRSAELRDKELPVSAEMMLHRIEKTLTKTVQELFLLYQSTKAQEKVAEKALELSRSQAEMQKRMAGLGMASSADVLAAEEGALQAENGLLQARAGAEKLRQNILILTGYDFNSQAELVPVGAPDLCRIEKMNPEADAAAAVGANYDLQDIRNGKAKGTAAKDVKNRKLEVSEQTVRGTVETLYASVLSQKQAYDGALAARDAAGKTAESAERMKSMGMMGNLEYTGAQLGLLSAEAAYESASVSLLQAMEEYDWAVKGLIISNGG